MKLMSENKTFKNHIKIFLLAEFITVTALVSGTTEPNVDDINVINAVWPN